MESGALRELLGQLGLAAVGAVSLTAERADRLADELAARGGMGREEARSIIEDATRRWRGGGRPGGGGPRPAPGGLFSDPPPLPQGGHQGAPAPGAPPP